MGLDLYHLRATLHPKNPAEASTFAEDDFDAEALDVLGFRRFIQTIPDWDYPTRIVIVKDEEALGVFRANGWSLEGDNGDVILLIGEPADLVRRVEEIEIANGWPPAERLTSMMSYWTSSRTKHSIGYGHGWGGNQKPLEEWTWDLTDHIRKELKLRPPIAPPVQKLVVYYPVPADYRGLHAEEVGYQRGLMSEGFYKEFRGTRPYVRRDDVLRAASFLRRVDDPETDARIQAHFHDQFIANFEEGTSILDASW